MMQDGSKCIFERRSLSLEESSILREVFSLLLDVESEERKIPSMTSSDLALLRTFENLIFGLSRMPPTGLTD
jgi:hypothetical protein